MLENGTWKVNDYGPTHTQVAKDSGSQPLHHLAVELAESAVKMVGDLFAINDKPEIIKLATSKLFMHPMYTDWMDEQVITWCKGHKAHVLLAREASIVLYGINHGYNEIAELYKEIDIISKFNTTLDQQTEYKSALGKMDSKFSTGKERLAALWKKRGLQERRIRTNEELEKEALKESGHGK